MIVCKDLAIGYDGQAIVDNINFTIEDGEYFVIIGENGAGKSTLMKTLLGLIKPIKGNISFSDDLKDGIGYLPQQTAIQKDFPASVYEIVLSGCINKKGFQPFYNKSDKQKAKEALEKMNIYQLKDKCYRELSGGQQQRVLLARALCATKKVLLLDEPVAGLDPLVTSEMYELINKLNKEDGITIIMISHDLEATIKYADHILHVDKEVYFASKQDYINSKLGQSYVLRNGSEEDDR